MAPINVLGDVVARRWAWSRLLAASTVLAAVLVPPAPAHASQAAVTGLELTSDSPGTLVVTWDAPAQVPTDYRVNWAESSDSFPSYKSNSGNAYPDTNSFSVPNPEEGVEYKVRVRARYRGAQLTGGQTKAWSTPWTETKTITVASLSPPARPKGLTGTTTHNSVTLTWNTSTDSTITSYQILRWQRGVDDPGDFQTLQDNTASNAATYVDTDVVAGERYVYRIKARNAAGLSGWSNYFNANLPNAPVTTTTQPPEPTPTTLPPQPSETLLEEGLIINNDNDPPPKTKGKGGGGIEVRSNNEATGAPTITGTTREGETLTADTSGIMDDDGLTNVNYSYQWVRTANSTDTNIGADSETYTLAAADVGNTIKVTVSFTDDANNAETLTSDPTAAIRSIWREAPSWPTSSADRGGKSATDVGDDGVDDYELKPQAMLGAEVFEIQWWDPICWFTLSGPITPYCPDAGDAEAQAAEEQRVKDAGIPAYLGRIEITQPSSENSALILTKLPVEGMYVVRIRARNAHGDPSAWSEYVYLEGSRGSPNSNLRWITESEIYGY